MTDLTEYIELFTRIFELEHKAAQGTALSIATLAESVDYDTIRHQRVPVIAEAMDMLNALQQVNESQQDFKRQQNAAHQQATASGVPLWALSEVETATSKIVDKEEFEILQLPRTPRRCVMIKEEVHECTAPEGTVTSQLAARHVPLVENWNEHVNYQCMCNHDLQTLGKSLIDDQGVVFEGRGGVMPVNDMRQQFVAKTENDEQLNDRGHGHENNGQNDRGCHQNNRDRGDDDRPPSHRPEGPVPREPIAPCAERRTEESPHPVSQAWSLPSPHNLRATTPGMNEAVKLHMDHMHDHLNRLVDDSLGVRFKFPDRVKPRQAEGKHIRAYAGGHKFSQLKDWAMDMC
ncbi:hypothetical protein C0995_014125 [Termitomyces sp. Mi166|nr:hypothetical protein C0995_014125 [Termitomyces sp. Mi166\